MINETERRTSISEKKNMSGITCSLFYSINLSEHKKGSSKLNIVGVENHIL